MDAAAVLAASSAAAVLAASSAAAVLAASSAAAVLAASSAAAVLAASSAAAKSAASCAGCSTPHPRSTRTALVLGDTQAVRPSAILVMASKPALQDAVPAACALASGVRTSSAAAEASTAAASTTTAQVPRASLLGAVCVLPVNKPGQPPLVLSIPIQGSAGGAHVPEC